MISYLLMQAGLPLLASPQPASLAAEFLLDIRDIQWLIGPMFGSTAMRVRTCGSCHSSYNAALKIMSGQWCNGSGCL